MSDIFLFFLVPGLVIIAAILTHRGSRQKFKIIKETNTLGESRYEVWFEYYSFHGLHGWLKEETFDTEDQANEFIARQHKIREVIREGKL